MKRLKISALVAVVAAAAVVVVLGARIFLVPRESRPPAVAQEAVSEPVTAGTTASPSPKECRASIDQETGGQTNPNCDLLEQASVTATIAHLKKVDQSCPPPTQKEKGGKCVLNQDVVLDEALDLASFTHLNCKGYRLTPTTVGSGATRSVPEVAFLLNGTFGAKIQDCVIDGFDFGVTIVNSKLPEEVKDDPGAVSLLSNKVLGNTITSRYQGVTIVSADNNQIKDNAISVTSGGGLNVSVWKDSDFNQIVNNTVTGNSSGAEASPWYPGGPDIDWFTADGIMIDGDAANLFNFLIGDTFLQFPSNTTDVDVPEGNLVEGNTVTLPYDVASQSPYAIFTTSSEGTVIRGNTINAAYLGIVSSGSYDDMLFVSQCSLDASRLCISDDDCFIAGVDESSKGTCGTRISREVDRRERDAVIEGNTLSDLAYGIDIGESINPMVRNNNISNVTFYGMGLYSAALETATATRNAISNVRVGFYLARGTAGFFGAKISLNDVTNPSLRAVNVPGAYPNAPGFNPTELSVDDRGNYWGHDCSYSGGLYNPGGFGFRPGILNSLSRTHFVGQNGWAVGSSGRILKTTNGGQSWTVQASGTTVSLSDVYFVNADTGWAVGQYGTILKTTNGGQTWTPQTSNTVAHLGRVFFVDANNGWADGSIPGVNDGIFLRTTNGGATWTVTSAGQILGLPAGIPGWLGSLRFFSSSVGWAVGGAPATYGGSGIFKTTNGGATWVRKFSVAQGQSAIFFADQQNGWTVGPVGSMYRTTDGGENWMPLTLGTTLSLSDVHFADTSTGWAVGSPGTIFKTTNGGNSWTSRFFGSTAAIGDVHALNASTVVVTGGDGFIRRTTNGGTSWVVAYNGEIVPAGADSNMPFVIDSHAYGVPVSATPDASLPAICQ